MASISERATAPMIIGAATAVGVLAGFTATIGAYWVTVEFLIKHSQYRAQSHGRLLILRVRAPRIPQ